MTERPLLASDVASFYGTYLNRAIGGRAHHMVVFHDEALPGALIEGLAGLDFTRLQLVPTDRGTDVGQVVERLWNPSEHYVSIHEFLVRTVIEEAASASRFYRHGVGGDFTTFEFPQLDYEPAKTVALLNSWVASAPVRQRERADRFFALLDGREDYLVWIRSGSGQPAMLEARGPAPWMELCGPLVEGDIRFAPAAELFRDGSALSGELCCDGGLNLVPIRGLPVEERLCRDLLAVSGSLAGDPVRVSIDNGKVTAAQRSSGRRDLLCDLLSSPPFDRVIEFGIGLMPSAAPFVHDWFAASNEAIPGVHLGFGADPGNIAEATTSLHFDLVCPSVEIRVNGEPFTPGADPGAAVKRSTGGRRVGA